MTASDWTTFGKTSGGSVGGAYLRPNKLKEGQSVKFRVLGSPVEGFERWTEDNKPVVIRLGEGWPEGKTWRTPTAERKESPKMFAAMPVWNYAEEAVQVLWFTQASIREAITSCVGHEDYGQPTGYDLTITRKGTGMDTEYGVVPSPPKPASEKAVAAWEAVLAKGFDLEALFVGGDPFNPIPF